MEEQETGQVKRGGGDKAKWNGQGKGKGMNRAQRNVQGGKGHGGKGQGGKGQGQGQGHKGNSQKWASPSILNISICIYCVHDIKYLDIHSHNNANDLYFKSSYSKLYVYIRCQKWPP